MKFKSFLLASVVAMTLAGCQTTSEKQTAKSVANVPLGVPLAANYRNEIEIARYSELLLSPEINNAQKAELFLRRGRLYDSVGLSTLARIDFNRAVQLKPDLASVYNFLGIHHTLAQDFGKAYEMFDAVLELDEDHQYAYLNRGIALYYGGRPELSSQDLEAFLARSPTDAYRVMWVYLAQAKVDSNAAYEQLKANSQALNPDEWSTQLVQLYLGQLTETQFLAQITEGVVGQQQYAERLCEAYFYLAKLYQARGKEAVAVDFFKLALATNVFEFVEHKYARLELELFAGVKAG